MQKLVEAQKYDNSLKDVQLNKLNNDVDVKQMEIDKLKKENDLLNTKLTVLKSQFESKENQHKHHIKKLTNDIDELKEKLMLGNIVCYYLFR